VAAARRHAAGNGRGHRAGASLRNRRATALNTASWAVRITALPPVPARIPRRPTCCISVYRRCGARRTRRMSICTI
jgi:hypothetical protein